MFLSNSLCIKTRSAQDLCFIWRQATAVTFLWYDMIGLKSWDIITQTLAYCTCWVDTFGLNCSCHKMNVSRMWAWREYTILSRWSGELRFNSKTKLFCLNSDWNLNFFIQSIAQTLPNWTMVLLFEINVLVIACTITHSLRTIPQNSWLKPPYLHLSQLVDLFCLGQGGIGVLRFVCGGSWLNGLP